MFDLFELYLISFEVEVHIRDKKKFGFSILYPSEKVDREHFHLVTANRPSPVSLDSGVTTWIGLEDSNARR